MLLCLYHNKKDIDIKVLVEWFLKAFLGSENKEYFTVA